MKYPLVTNWGWLISFFMISIFNGCMINVSKVEPIFLQPSQLKPLLVIYFAIYPLAATIYIFFKSTKILISVLIGSQFLLAAVLCYLKLPALNPLFVGLLGFNILLFVFVLIFVCKTRGIVVPAFILFFTITLTVVGLGQWAFQLIWYCNLIVTNNKAGRQLRNALDSFDAAMVSLSGIAAIGLAIGWAIGGFSG
ncbi:MAG: hypothetical protein WBA41_10575 [Rivularia sp. (in: cyanobacteria)]